MIQQFYDIVHQDVVDTQAKIRNTESEMERMQDAHRNDIRVCFFVLLIVFGHQLIFILIRCTDLCSKGQTFGVRTQK